MYKFVMISVRNLEKGEKELNEFVSSHEIVQVYTDFVAMGESSYYLYRIEYKSKMTVPASPSKLAGNGNEKVVGRVSLARPSSRPSRERVDYKTVLSEEDFGFFATLRVWRNNLAASLAIAIYGICTNDQLAWIVKDRVTTKAGLERIFGLGEARVEKYGDLFLEQTRLLWSEGNEKSGEPVSQDLGTGELAGGVSQGA